MRLVPSASHGRMTALILVIILLTASAPFSIRETRAGQQATEQGCQAIFAPAYYWYDLNFFPQWDELIHANSENMTVIVGIPLSQGQVDPAYAWVIQQAREQGIRVLAYVQTYFGQRDPNELKMVIEHLEDWYDIDGIFIDEVMPDHDMVDYYADIVAEARKYPNQTVVINPGGTASIDYVEMADMIVTFEGNFDQYMNLEIPDWMSEYDASRFIHIVHSTSNDKMEQVLDISRTRNVANIYVTDDRGANAYHLLPTYWEQEVQAIADACE